MICEAEHWSALAEVDWNGLPWIRQLKRHVTRRSTTVPGVVGTIAFVLTDPVTARAAHAIVDINESGVTLRPRDRDDDTSPGAWVIGSATDWMRLLSCKTASALQRLQLYGDAALLDALCNDTPVAPCAEAPIACDSARPLTDF